MNAGWRAEREWPLTRQVVTDFFFEENGRLGPSQGTNGQDEYKVDFRQSALYGKNNSDRWFMMAPPDELMIRTDKDRQCLVYETEVLTQDLEVTGHPIADLWLASNQKDGDVFVYLVDVDEQGRSLHVTEGELRASWRALHPDTDQIPGIAAVRPKLPWHGYRKAEEEKGTLDPAKPLNLRFDLYPTSWVFRKGHRIRISLAGADYPNFELNPRLSPGGKPEECPDTRWRIFRTKEFASRIELPIIPRQ
jgi:putative CocE/NonD family hydrolase